MKIKEAFFALIICVFPFASAFAQTEWPILKHYDENHISKIAMPIGGIGTGTVSINGRGSLVDWEIMNRPGKGFSTVTPGNDAPFFAIYINDGEKSYTKGLMGPLLDFEYEHMEGRPVDHHGIPRFEKSTFDAAYPFGIVNLSDSNLPVEVKIKAFNPLIPGDAHASGIPIAVLQYEVENKTGKPLEVSVCGSIRNFIGKDGSNYRVDWKGDKPNETRFIRNQAIAISDSPTGPFKMQAKPVIDDLDTEDVSLWYDKQRDYFYAIFHAHVFIGMVSSPDGINWSKATEYEVMTKKVPMTNGDFLEPGRMERPFVYLENGEPQVLSLAVGKDGDAYIIFVPVASK